VPVEGTTCVSLKAVASKCHLILVVIWSDGEGEYGVPDDSLPFKCSDEKIFSLFLKLPWAESSDTSCRKNFEVLGNLENEQEVKVWRAQFLVNAKLVPGWVSTHWTGSVFKSSGFSLKPEGGTVCVVELYNIISARFTEDRREPDS
jgi:hypothetical protein